ncbi:hypothetical protein [Phyllobacterium sp. CL33Tsu]|uniref:hypothetical protein n=1 Tax=Phyllobacterium sp. CL33Tsu TaxID=1798191 RepID=UPI001113FC6C|nr:hypothetical protein [Phyllobacterium sp. CL33Tsu]
MLAILKSNSKQSLFVAAFSALLTYLFGRFNFEPPLIAMSLNTQSKFLASLRLSNVPGDRYEAGFSDAVSGDRAGESRFFSAGTILKKRKRRSNRGTFRRRAG